MQVPFSIGHGVVICPKRLAASRLADKLWLKLGATSHKRVSFMAYNQLIGERGNVGGTLDAGAHGLRVV